MYIEIYKSHDNLYVAACPDLELFSKGRTEREACKKLKESIKSYLKTAREVERDLKDSARYYSLNYPQEH